MGRSFGVALAAGVAAVVLSLGPPASANHGAPHASDQGQASASANSQSAASANSQSAASANSQSAASANSQSAASANSQSAEHAQNDRAGNDEAAAQQAAGAGAASNGDTQGASGSNPDGGGIDKPWCGTDGNLECQGTSDFDGNNGCGNDADREDDNNGNCGGGPVKAKECPPARARASARGVERADERNRIRQCASAATANPATPEGTAAVAGTTAEVAGTNFGRPSDTANILASVAAAAGTTTAGGSGAQDATQVLGVSFERQAAPDPAGSPAGSPAQVKGIQFERGQLGRTGLDTALLVLIALGLVGSGASLKRLAHRP